MIHKKLLNGTLSLVVLASSLSAQGNCPTCTVDLKNLKPRKVVQPKGEFKHHYSRKVIKDSAYDIVVDGRVTVVFSSYVMTAEEKAAYYREQKAIALNKKANEEENNRLRVISQPVEKIEDKILNKNLPTSEYFCDNDKKPVLLKDSDLYECVS